MVADLAAYCDGTVMLFATTEQSDRLQAHRQAGGRTAFWRQDRLILAEGQRELEVLSRQRPAVARQISQGTLTPLDILVAAACGWALGLAPDMIRAGVKSYAPPALH